MAGGFCHDVPRNNRQQAAQVQFNSSPHLPPHTYTSNKYTKTRKLDIYFTPVVELVMI